MSEHPQHSGQGTPKLHDLRRELGYGVLVYAEPCVVDDDTWAAVDFFLDHQRREAEVLSQAPNLLKREYHPEASIDEVHHLVTEEVPVCHAQQPLTVSYE